MDVLETPRLDFFPIVPPANATGNDTASTTVAGEFAQALAQAPEPVATDGLLAGPAISVPVLPVLVEEISSEATTAWTAVIPWVTTVLPQLEVTSPEVPVDVPTVTPDAVPVVKTSPPEACQAPPIPQVFAIAIGQNVKRPAPSPAVSDGLSSVAPDVIEETSVPMWVQHTLAAALAFPPATVFSEELPTSIPVNIPTVETELPASKSPDRDDSDILPVVAVPSFVIHTLPAVVQPLPTPTLPAVPIPSASLPLQGTNTVVESVSIATNSPPQDSSSGISLPVPVPVQPAAPVASSALPASVTPVEPRANTVPTVAALAVQPERHDAVRSDSAVQRDPSPAIIPIAERSSSDNIAPARHQPELATPQVPAKRSTIPEQNISTTQSDENAPSAVDRHANPTPPLQNGTVTASSGNSKPSATPAVARSVQEPNSKPPTPTREVNRLIGDAPLPLTPTTNNVAVQAQPTPPSTSVVAAETPQSPVVSVPSVPASSSVPVNTATVTVPETPVDPRRAEPLPNRTSVVSKPVDQIPSPALTIPDEPLDLSVGQTDRSAPSPRALPESRAREIQEPLPGERVLMEPTPPVMRVESLRTDAPALDFGDPVPIHHAEQLIQRLGDAIGFARDARQELSIRVTPPQFGPIVIEVRVHDGALTARVETHSALAHEMITDHLPQLHESLASRGATLDRIDVVPVEQRAVQERITPSERFASERESLSNGWVSAGTSERQGTDSQDQNRRRPPRPQPVPVVETPAAVAPSANGRPMELQGLNVRV